MIYDPSKDQLPDFAAKRINEAASRHRQAKAALKEAENAMLTGEFARAMALSQLSTAYSALADYRGIE